VKRVLILGAGFGGLETAFGLTAAMKSGYEITLVDKSDGFYVGFSKIDVLFGHRSADEIKSRFDDLRADGVRFVRAQVTSIDTDARSVVTTKGNFGYDYLVVALGAALDDDAIPGFVESGAYEYYCLEGAELLRPVLESFSRGTLLMPIFKLPYKCPPAPYEVACQLHERFVRKGVRGAITMKMVIPGPRPVDSPGVSDALEKLLSERDIELIPKTSITSIDAAARRAIHAGGAIDYDLLVGVPVHVPPEAVRRSKLGPGFVKVSPTNLETSVPDVYAVGDVSTVPVADKAVPKAGAFAEDAARTVVSDILRKEGLADGLAKFDAAGTCYVEVGGGEVGMVVANFLGGEKPQMAFEGPSAALKSRKLEFESSRRERWFRTR
jgi:sulfide:quinone oxidoreductase